MLKNNYLPAWFQKARSKCGWRQAKVTKHWGWLCVLTTPLWWIWNILAKSGGADIHFCCTKHIFKTNPQKILWDRHSLFSLMYKTIYPNKGTFKIANRQTRKHTKQKPNTIYDVKWTNLTDFIRKSLNETTCNALLSIKPVNFIIIVNFLVSTI